MTSKIRQTAMIVANTAELSAFGVGELKTFAVAVKSSHRAPVLTVTGDLDLRTAPHLVALMARELRQRPALLILDLTEADFLGVPAVAAMMTGWRQWGAPSQLRLVARKKAILRSIHLTGWDEFVAVYDSLESAIRETPPLPKLRA
ncbi:STAS domain-containing protein [Amycolatopsis albispora]|uniref:STAS domain-containing protein n=1 Tax=Amycolatopsis albispora TaxID=1804986 RepID=A0A344L9M9_9PSEU|nr:STAS domain-containing protein [Amycolatopsis albispora]AXB44753.1 hypothetical protein A4R43_21490 [Amycolatopsis albispora]